MPEKPTYEEMAQRVQELEQIELKFKQTKEDLLDLENKFRITFHANPAGMVITRLSDGKVIDLNQSFTNITGYSYENAIGRSGVELGFWVKPENRMVAVRKLKEHNGFRNIEFDFKNKSGEIRTGLFSSEIINIKSEPCIITALNDITERKQAEAERNRLISAIEQVAEVIIMTDASGNILYANPAFERNTGYSRQEVIGKNPRILKSGKHDNAFYKKMWNTLARGETWSGQIINKRKNGTLFTEEATISPVSNDSGRPNNFVAVKRDITDEISMEKKLHQAQKMESIGTLAGGIAHDFNNILSAVLGYTELALFDIEPGSHLEDNLQEVISAGKRARDLVRQILTFARQADEEVKPLAIHVVVKETLKFLRASIPTTIEFKERIKSQSLIMADPTQVHQILMNLCTNASQAMEDQGGVLEVGLVDIEVDEELASLTTHLKPGAYIKLSVSDTGPGISPDIMGSIFDPYFTTKAPSEGTGMGLAVVHGIVHKYGGDITVNSLPGKGTKFTIYLPLVKRRVRSQSRRVEAIPSGTERILFVDDEVPLATMGGRILERLGYQVTLRSSSVEALELFRSKPDGFDLILTDMTMPNMTGDILAAEMMAIRPDIPVIICTGYSKKLSDEMVQEIGIKALTYKPLVKGDLAKTIRKVLDEAQKKRPQE